MKIRIATEIIKNILVSSLILYLASGVIKDNFKKDKDEKFKNTDFDDDDLFKKTDFD